MVKCEIYTEDKGREEIKELLDKEFLGYTVTFSIGVWEGKEEKSLVITIIGHAEQERKIKEVAEKIGFVNGQTCVLVTKQTLDGVWFITPKA